MIKKVFFMSFIIFIVSGTNVHAQWSTSDTWGYTGVDTIPYSWVPYDGSWTDTGIIEDDEFITVSLPFVFTFYGLGYSNISISSNGYLTFGMDGDEYYNHPCMPIAALPNFVIAPFWDDLNPELGGSGIHYTTTGASPNRTFMVLWRDIPHADADSSTMTFEVILHETTNRIVFQYSSMLGTLGDGNSATIGIEADSEAMGIQYDDWCTQGITTSGLALEFAPPAVPPTPTATFTVSPTPTETHTDAGSPTPSFTPTFSPTLNMTPGAWIQTDSFGYTGIAGTTYDWIPYDATWTDTSLHTDDDSITIFLPFSFTFYGISYPAVSIGTNGYLSFGGEDATGSDKAPIPDTGSPNNIICPFWDDLDPESGGYGIHYTTIGATPDRKFVVSWRRIPHYFEPYASSHTFQVILHETTNDIAFQYKSMVGMYANGLHSTVGIENSDGTIGLQYRDTGIPGVTTDNFAILFTLSAPPVPAATRIPIFLIIFGFVILIGSYGYKTVFPH